MHFSNDTVVDVICDDNSKGVMEDIIGSESIKKIFDNKDKICDNIDDNIKLIVENYVGIRSFKPPIEISKIFHDLSEQNKIQIDSSSEEYNKLNEEHFKIKIKDILDDIKSLGTGIVIDALRIFLERFMEVGYKKLTSECNRKEFKFGLVSKNGNSYKFLIFSFLYDIYEINHNMRLILSLNKSKDNIHYSHYYSTFTIAKIQLHRYLEGIYNEYYHHMKNGKEIDSKTFQLADIIFYKLYREKVKPDYILEYMVNS